MKTPTAAGLPLNFIFLLCKHTNDYVIVSLQGQKRDNKMSMQYMNKLQVFLSHIEDAEDRILLMAEIQRKEDLGWTWDDAFSYITCFEEYNPNLSEESALSRMSYLERKYKKL